jgi:glutamine amidotransferase
MTPRATASGRAAPNRLAIFDYGAGNLHSLVKAITADDRNIAIETDLRAATKTNMLVLPGVGAFGTAASVMGNRQSYLRAALDDGLPCLGICLGMQLLFDASEEAAGKGVGFIAGNVTRLRTSRVPHMGWNDIEWRENEDGPTDRRLGTAYFANAYVCQPEDQSSILAWTTHQDARFASIIRKTNTVGVQFHPEKSSFAGRVFVNAMIEDLIKCR